jgi:hypothetical protein
MDDEEYNDAYFCDIFLKKYLYPTQPNPLEKTDTLRLIQEFNETLFKYTRKTIEITLLSIIIDDIKNYRPLSDLQIEQLENFTHEEKLKVIKVYNTMYSSIKGLLEIVNP